MPEALFILARFFRCIFGGSQYDLKAYRITNVADRAWLHRYWLALLVFLKE
jgi:hypothetical protein